MQTCHYFVFFTSILCYFCGIAARRWMIYDKQKYQTPVADTDETDKEIQNTGKIMENTLNDNDFVTEEHIASLEQKMNEAGEKKKRKIPYALKRKWWPVEVNQEAGSKKSKNKIRDSDKSLEIYHNIQKQVYDSNEVRRWTAESITNNKRKLSDNARPWYEVKRTKNASTKQMLTGLSVINNIVTKQPENVIVSTNNMIEGEHPIQVLTLNNVAQTNIVSEAPLAAKQEMNLQNIGNQDLISAMQYSNQAGIKIDTLPGKLPNVPLEYQQPKINQEGFLSAYPPQNLPVFPPRMELRPPSENIPYNPPLEQQSYGMAVPYPFNKPDENVFIPTPQQSNAVEYPINQPMRPPQPLRINLPMPPTYLNTNEKRPPFVQANVPARDYKRLFRQSNNNIISMLHRRKPQRPVPMSAGMYEPARKPREEAPRVYNNVQPFTNQRQTPTFNQKQKDGDYESYEEAWHNYAKAFRELRGISSVRRKKVGFTRDAPCDPVYSFCDERKKAFYFKAFDDKAMKQRELGSILSKDYKTFVTSNSWFLKNTVKNLGDAFLKGIQVIAGKRQF